MAESLQHYEPGESMRNTITVFVLLALFMSSFVSFAQTNEATQGLHAALLDHQITPGIIKALKVRGADFNAPFADGRLPLDVAIENKVSHSTLRALIAAGAMISAQTDISQFREGFQAHFTRVAPAAEAARAAQAAAPCFPSLPSATLAWCMEQAPDNTPMETDAATVIAAAEAAAQAAAYFPPLPADAIACPIDRPQTHAPATAAVRVVQPQNPPTLLSSALISPRSLSMIRLPYDATSSSTFQ
jgi:hypothetical protein